MPGEEVVKGAQPVEHIEETVFGEPEEDANWEWIGYVTSHSVSQESTSETFTHLPPAGADNKLEQKQNVKVAEAYSGDLTYHPQDFNLLEFFTGEDGTTSGTIPSWQIGEQHEEADQYRRILGVVGEDWEMSVAEDSVAEVSASWSAADAEDWSGTDYTEPDGSHATAVEDNTFSYSDLGQVELGGANIDGAIEELTVSVSNDLEVTKDPNSPFDTNIHAIDVTNRDVTVELTMTYESFDMAQTVRNYEPQDLTFDFPDSTIDGFGPISWTIPDVQFPEFPYEMSPEDLVGDTISSDPATGILWS